MQQEEHPGQSPSTCQSVSVNEIRRQWAVHEDEALAYRLQNEEITQHYSGNRFRNAIVREDVPRAREEQQREEQEALQERFRHIEMLQQQAVNDELLAKQLAERYQMGVGTSLDPDFADSLVNGASSGAALRINNSLSEKPVESESRQDAVYAQSTKNTDHHSTSPVGTSQMSSTKESPSTSNGVERKVKSIMKPVSSRKEQFTPLMTAASSSMEGAGATRISPPLAIALAINPELPATDLPTCKRRLQEEEAKLLQEKLDEVIAFKLQKQLEEMEIETAKRIEAQDRELAKIIHQKEKERLRRAKERAKLKAAALLSSSPENSSSSSAPEKCASPEHGNDMATNSTGSSSSRSAHSSSRSCGDRKSPSSSWNFDNPPPNIPEKSRDRDDPVKFRAASKALPPNPKSPSRSNYDDMEKPPPYMPLQGLQNLQKKRNK